VTPCPNVHHRTTYSSSEPVAFGQHRVGSWPALLMVTSL
jgi:hypothetical protein